MNLLDPLGLSCAGWGQPSDNNFTIAGGWTGPDSTALNNGLLPGADYGLAGSGAGENESGNPSDVIANYLSATGMANDAIALSPLAEYNIGVSTATGEFEGLYSAAFHGNGSVSVINIGEAAESGSIGTAWVGAVYDGYGYFSGQESGAQAFAGIDAAALSGMVGGPIGATIGASYSLGKDAINYDAEQLFQLYTDSEYGVNCE